MTRWIKLGLVVSVGLGVVLAVLILESSSGPGVGKEIASDAMPETVAPDESNHKTFEAERQPTPNADPKPDETDDAPATSGKPFLLRVIDGRTELPLSSVPVQYVASGDTWSYPATTYWFDPQWLKEHAEVYTTNAVGEVALPPFQRAGRVTVEHGGQRGDLTLMMPLVGTPVLRVEATEWLSVRVVNPRGQAVADVPLTLKSPPQGFLLCGNVMDSVLWEGETVDGSVTRIGPLGPLLEEFLQPASSGGANGQPYLQLGVIDARLPHHELDPFQMPGDVLQLAIPETGQLTVELRGPDGERFLDVATVTAHAKSDEVQVFQREDQTSTLTQEGRAHFPFVALGTEVWVRASTTSGLTASKLVSALIYEGEQKAEVLTLERPMSHGKVLLTGRLRPAGGKMATDLPLESILSLQDPKNGMGLWSERWSSLSIGPGGAFEAVVGAWRLPSVLNLRSANGIVPGNDRPVVEGAVLLDAAPEVSRISQSVELGDVSLKAAPLLVSGRVIAEDGAPVGGASISMTMQDSYTSTNVAVSGEDGRFSVFVGRDRIRSTYLDASARGYYSNRMKRNKSGYLTKELIRFEVGQTDMEVVLKRQAVVTGRVLLDPGITHRLLDMNARSDSGTVSVRRGTDGQFQLAGVPGKAQLSISLDQGSNHDEESLTTVEVDLSRPDDSLEVDLRGRIQRTLLVVVDEQGKPCEVQVDWVGEQRYSPYYSSTGVLTLFATTPVQRKIKILPLGGRLVESELEPGRQVVVVEPGFAVDLRLSEAMKVPRGWTMELSCFPVSPEELGTPGGVADLIDPVEITDSVGPEAEHRIRLPAAGRYEVTWTLRDNARFGNHISRSEEFELADKDTPQTISLTPPTDEEIQAAIVNLRRQ